MERGQAYANFENIENTEEQGSNPKKSAAPKIENRINLGAYSTSSM